MNPQESYAGTLESRTNFSVINPIVPNPFEFSSMEEVADTFRKQREEREDFSKRIKEIKYALGKKIIGQLRVRGYTLAKFEEYKQNLEKIRGEPISDNLAYRVLRRDLSGTFPKKEKNKAKKITLLL